MHDWFLTACLLGFCQQDKNVWKIWEVCFNLSVWPLALLWHGRFAGNRERRIWESLCVSLPSPTTYYRNKSAQCIQLRLCSSSGLCDLWAPTVFLILLSAASPHHTITCWCYWWPSLQKDWGTIMCSQNIHTASRRQCVTKEQFLSSSKVCSKSFCKILSGLFFLYCNTLLGSS